MCVCVCVCVFFFNRDYSGSECKSMHLVNQTFGTQKQLMESVHKLAVDLAEKDEYAVKGTKHVLLHARENSTESALNYVAVWNTAFLKKEQIMKQLAKRKKPKGKIKSKL